MKYLCPGCKQIFERDMRKQENKHFSMKNGYKSYCDKKHKDFICKAIKGEINEML